MIDDKLKGQILRYHLVDKWTVSAIASHLNVHHSTVQRALCGAGVQVHQEPRARMVDPYLPFMMEKLEKYPKLHASRLYQMVKDLGYPGKPDHFRGVVAQHRPHPPAQAYLRLQTLPGEQAQVDWGYFGKLRLGNRMHRLSAFVMVLSYCRQVFLQFYLGQHMSLFVLGHQQAFEFFEGVPRVLLYDNLKSAVLERQGEAIHFNSQFLQFAAHHLFEPRPVAVRRGNQKGRVERAIQYIRHAFLRRGNSRTWPTSTRRPCISAWVCPRSAGDPRTRQDPDGQGGLFGGTPAAVAPAQGALSGGAHDFGLRGQDALRPLRQE